MKNVTWSHSALKDYEGCPRRYYEVKVLNKYPFRDTVHTIYGKDGKIESRPVLTEAPTTAVAAGVLTITVGGSNDNNYRVFEITGRSQVGDFS